MEYFHLTQLPYELGATLMESVQCGTQVNEKFALICIGVEAN